MSSVLSAEIAARGKRDPQTPALGAAPRAVEDGLPLPRRAVALGALLAATVLVVLDGAIANVALPSIAHALDVSSADCVWVVAAYQLGVVVALLPCAALGESYGGRKVFVAGISVFAAASALCALAPNLPLLAAARFIQGIGGGAIMALGPMMLRFASPQRLIGRVIAWNAMVIALSSAAGPGVGAAILAIADWPWLFAVNLPIAALVLVAGRALPGPRGTGCSLDLVSAAINTCMFALFVFGGDRIAAQPGRGAAMILGAVLCLAALVRRERAREAPLVPIDLLRSGAFRLAAIASVCCFAAQMMGIVALPFYFQRELGESVVATGLLMTPWPIAVALAAPISARLSDRVSTALICAAGGACLALGLALAGAWPLRHDLAPIIVGTILAGIGFGLFQTANNRILLLSAPKARSGAAGGAQGTARLLGQTIGAVGMGLLFELASAGAAPRIGLVVAALCALSASGVSALRLRREGRG
ncbi:MAG TPA: MFS transporter [Roseiarcus sp.]|nr:MFS transporter [Roseiarcus sp.]